jgi:hypothetical protein
MGSEEMNYDLSHVSIGNAVAIGKIRLVPSDGVKYHMPMLHFIVLKDSQGAYSSTCIQLRVEGFGNTIDDTLADLKTNILDFVKGTFTNAPELEDAYGSFYSLMEIDSWAAEWWNAYRKLQMKLSLRGIKTDFFEVLEDEINFLKKRIADLESAQNKYKFLTLKKEQELSVEIVDFREVA